MVVLHLIPHLVKGGAERQLVYLASHAARKGNEVHVAYLAGSPVPPGLADLGVTLHPLAHLANHDPLLLFRLIALIRKVRPAVVQTWILQMDVLGGAAALLTNTAWLLREPVSGLHWDNGLKSRLRLWLGSRADAIVSNSAGGDAYWANHVAPARRWIIDNAVPVDEISSTAPLAADALGFSNDAPLIVAAGRLDEQKNFAVLIDALAEVCMRSDANAVIFGDGPLRPDLEGLVRKYGLQRKILLPGRIPTIWGALKSAAVFVSMSRYEGLPNVVLEAMVCGCPLVVSDIPSHRAIVDDTTAAIVQAYEDPNVVASAMIEVLENRSDATIRSRAARDRIDSKYSIQTVSERYEAVHRTIVDRLCK